MIITRTPFRISFFGGGTDYPAWYRKKGGSVLATTIDKYCYISCRSLPPFFEHKTRVVYSKIENCHTIEEIQHPAVREILKYLDMRKGLEIHHDGDLPARSGVGSSSSFTVGLLHALLAFRGEMPSKHQLAMDSIHIEQKVIKEVVGSQDQVLAAYGGLNHVIFDTGGDIVVRPLTLSRERFAELNSHLMLFYTGIKRTASDVAKSYVDNIKSKQEHLQVIHRMVDESISILCSDQCISHFGELLHESWQSKRKLSSQVSNPVIDGLYRKAREGGAIGGKITGAGGGGFLLLFVPPTVQKEVCRALEGLIRVPFTFEHSGSQIIFYEPEKEDYSSLEKKRSFPIQPFKELDTIRKVDGPVSG